METLDGTQAPVFERVKDVAQSFFEHFPMGTLASHGDHTFQSVETPPVVTVEQVV